MRPRSAVTLVLLVGPLAALVACAPADEPAASGASTSSGGSATSDGTAGDCSPGALQTLTPRTLTVATSEPAYSPWVVDDDPASGEGFESAVAYAVAEQLGYAEGDVEWGRADFNAAIAPGPKTFDVNQFSITPERAEAVDFSSPYYQVRQAVVATGASPAAGATSLADLRGVRLGAQVGTTSLQAITEAIAPTTEPAVFSTNEDAVLALTNGQVDALVVDLPTALYLASAELDDGTVVGQLPAAEGATDGAEEAFGMVMELDSPLTDCVSGAVDALRDDGTLAELEQQWLAEAADAPVLQ